MVKVRKSGFQIFAVGGSVRDMILGRKTRDWDFTTDAPPESILKIFPDGFYDNKFGTVGVPIEEIKPDKSKQTEVYEITTFRKETGYTDHRHPDLVVWGKTLEDDLKRRDFTINSIAYDGTKIIDPFGGSDDIANKLIKAVGDPGLRFNEDALRMIRAVRLAVELSFIIEQETAKAILDNASLIKKISQERIRDELFKILSSDFPDEGIKLLKNVGLLIYILPEIEACFGVEQKSPKRHHIYDVGTHSLMSLKYCPSKDPVVRLATLLHDAGKAATFKINPDGVITFYNHEIVSGRIAQKISERLRLSKKDSEKLFKLVRFHQFTVEENQTDTALRRFIRNIGKENIEDMLSLRTGDRLGGGARETSWRLELFKKRLLEVQKQPFTTSDLKVDGFDVMKIFNVKPGPAVGSVLGIIFQEVISGKLKNEREELLKKMTEMKKSKVQLSPTKPSD